MQTSYLYTAARRDPRIQRAVRPHPVALVLWVSTGLVTHTRNRRAYFRLEFLTTSQAALLGCSAKAMSDILKVLRRTMQWEIPIDQTVLHR